MANTKTQNTNKMKMGECSSKINAYITNTVSSPRDSSTIYFKVLIANAENSLTISYERFLQLLDALNADGTKAAIITQDHKAANSTYNITAKPAIAVFAHINDNNTVQLNVKESMPGRAYDRKKDASKAYTLIVDKQLLQEYFIVINNDFKVKKDREETKKADLLLNLND